MSSITKKQTVVAIVAVVFASAMILGTIAAASDQSAFAKHHKHHKHHKHSGDSTSQRISQTNAHSSSVNCQSNGGSAIGTGNGLVAGVGAGVGGNGGTNVCFDNNPQINANTGNNLVTP
ncbi:MAG: hypothetical protein ACTHKJ_07020 [Candidatus Nitrosocosmicus sp.]